MGSLRPDRININATSYTTSDLDSSVTLRLSPDDPDNTKPPILVPTLLGQAAQRAPNGIALVSAPKEDGSLEKWTYGAYLKDARAAAKGFISLGLGRKRGVAITGFNSPEWFIADVGTTMAGGIVVGIYQTSSPEICKFVVSDSRTEIVVAEDTTQVEKFTSLPNIKAIIQYSGSVTSKRHDHNQEMKIISWQDLIDLGKQFPDDALDERMSTMYVNECCRLVYTSGTTGYPKGVMLSHDNLTYTAKVLANHYSIRKDCVTLISYLPLSHIAAYIVDCLAVMFARGTVHFADRDALKGSLLDTTKRVRPTIFLGVPRVYEKIYERMTAIARDTKGIKRIVASWSKDQGLMHHSRWMTGHAEDESDQDRKTLKFMLAEKLVFNKVKAALGFDRCFIMATAAAPMPMHVMEYFLSLNMRLLEVYGMSETSGPQTISHWKCQKVGTVGATPAGFHTKLENSSCKDSLSGRSGNGRMSLEGEVCMRGRNIMMGYANRPDQTAQAIDPDGWLHSGDLGTRLSYGQQQSQQIIKITGRIRDILITAGGENIAPVPIENAIKKCLPCVSQAVLVGERKKFVSVLISLNSAVDAATNEPTDMLDTESLQWVKEAKGSAKTVTEARHDQVVLSAIQAGIDRANEEVPSRAQTVKKFTIMPRDLSIAGGELGPTLKVKRYIVWKKYADEIEKMYA